MIYFHSAVRLKFNDCNNIRGTLSAIDDFHAFLWLAVFRRHNSVQFLHRVLYGVIDDEIIVGMGRLELHFGPQQALLNFVLAVGATFGQTALQFSPTRWSNEDAHGLRPFTGDLNGALNLNVQDDILTLFMASSTNRFGVP